MSIDMVVPDPDASSKFVALLYNNRKCNKNSPVF